MVYLLLGPDDFSKKEYVKLLALEQKAEADFFDEENQPRLEDLITNDLFAKPKVYALKSLITKYNSPENIDKMVRAKNAIVFIEEKLDKRQTQNKELLANKSISVKEFALPHGPELNHWLEKRVKFYEGSITHQAVEALAVRLGRDDARETKVGGKVIASEEIYNLWQADSEVRKLISFAQGKEITEIDVGNISSENKETDVFSLTNAIADNEKQKAINLLQQFLKEQGTDEKAAVIQLNALLSEQFRNVAAVQSLVSSKISEEDILEKTGWKSGRLFVMKKVAGKFAPEKVLETLNKLAALDLELKTSQTPPKVLLDLIVTQLF